MPTRTLKEKLKLHEADDSLTDKTDYATGAKINNPRNLGDSQGGRSPLERAFGHFSHEGKVPRGTGLEAPKVSNRNSSLPPRREDKNKKLPLKENLKKTF